VLIAIVGPTAAGKSDLAVELALALDGEVINADSMQLYRGMDIGTAKLTAAERKGVPHHLLDVWDVTTPASVAEYQELADVAIADIEARGKVPVLVGGSGLYIRAALGDLEFPGTDEAVRQRLEAQLAAIDAVRAGVSTAHVDRQARKVLTGYGLDKAFVHSTGHGLGLEIHEPPRIGKRDKGKLETGMAVTIEPGVYLEGFGGIRIEDTIEVTPSGCRILTPTSKDLRTI